MKRLRLILAALALALTARSASAHVFAPSLLELRQVDSENALDVSDTFDVRWKQPELLPSGAHASPVLPSSCEAVAEKGLRREETGISVLWTVQCPGGVEGKTVGIDGLASTQASALLRVEWQDGRSVRHVLKADQPIFTIPAEESTFGVLKSYGHLGIEHIAGGIDHLLFVLALVLLVQGRPHWPRALLLTVTAFTLGHSVTLALASLGFVNLPQAPVEILIALSIYVLAVELARRRAKRARGIHSESWMERRPGWMAAGFGLFHGLGFAGALTETGLPQGDVPAALFAFNVGIELGQLAFVAFVLAISAVVARLPGVVRYPQLALAPVYLIGCVSAFWVLERIAA